MPSCKATDTIGREDTRYRPVATQSNALNDKRDENIVRIHIQRDIEVREYAATIPQHVTEKLPTTIKPIYFFAFSLMWQR